MNSENINSIYTDTCNCIVEGKIKEAFNNILSLAQVAKSGAVSDDCNLLSTSYNMMLQYSFKGGDDPQRETVYVDIQKSAYTLLDRAKEVALIQTSSSEIYSKIRELHTKQVSIGKPKVNGVEDLFFYSNLALVNESIEIDNASREELVNNIFNQLWLTDKYTDTEDSLIADLRNHSTFTWSDRSAFVSAIMLSCLRCFDEQKIYHLIDFIEDGEDEVWIRAFVSLLIVLAIYDKRLPVYRTLNSRLKIFAETDYTDTISKICVQMQRTLETDSITKKMYEEVLPEVSKLTSKFDDKLGLKDIDDDYDSEDINPNWADFIEEDSELKDKMQEMSEMQMEGGDILMSTFSMLKYFDFFKSTTNWFMPFYYPNEELEHKLETEMTEGIEASKIIESLSKAPFMCNSDKYSFIYNIIDGMMPKVQKDMLLSQYSAALDNMEEVGHEESVSDVGFKDKFVIVRYLQDLYRFCKVSPLKNDFSFIFTTGFNIYNKDFISYFPNRSKVLQAAGQYLFENGKYSEAIEAFGQLADIEEYAQEVVEKLAFCYHKQQNYSMAINYYEKALLYDNDKLWLLKKIGFCLRKMHRFEEAIENFKSAVLLNKEDLNVYSSLGSCYIEVGEYEKALECYYKVNYYKPDNHKIIKPIAWCLFMTNKYENSLDYYNKLSVEDITKYDLINIGHQHLVTKNYAEAINSYTKSINKFGSFSRFMTIFEEDKSILLDKGIGILDYKLLIDLLRQ